MRLIDLSGQSFGKLTVLERAPNDGRRTMWACRCSCGKSSIVDADHLRTGHTTSCGCAWVEKCRKHGHAHDRFGRQSRTYKAWVNMRSRADGVTEKYQEYYVDRKISVCDRWQRFENFLADMGECPKGMSLDRRDNNGNYEPKNCRWATPKEQTINRRKTLFVEFGGSRLCLKDACSRAGVLYDTALKRVRRGMTPQQAIQP